ncbi:hypothetical protein ACLOAU_03470 [Niabella sp. CJ426]|uniref:hypothetical protein n=1 Tax=Niabella sp. CJ426 TaxID=3393740 RepID=UPI003D003696
MFYLLCGLNLPAQTVVYGIPTSKAQEKLIDEFIEVSQFKKALLQAASIKVSVLAMTANQTRKDSITQEDVTGILKEIYNDYNYKEKYYTEFATVTEKQLASLIKFYKENASLSKEGQYIFCPVNLFHNLDNDIQHATKSVLENKNKK